MVSEPPLLRRILNCLHLSWQTLQLAAVVLVYQRFCVDRIFCSMVALGFLQCSMHTWSVPMRSLLQDCPNGARLFRGHGGVLHRLPPPPDHPAPLPPHREVRYHCIAQNPHNPKAMT
eukprot:4632875-Amphidinium_carterae.1